MRKRKTERRRKMPCGWAAGLFAFAFVRATTLSAGVGCLAEIEEPEDETTGESSGEEDGTLETEQELADDNMPYQLGARCPDDDADHLSDPQPDPWHLRRVPVAPPREDSEDDEGSHLTEPQPDPWHGEAPTDERAGERDRE